MSPSTVACLRCLLASLPILAASESTSRRRPLRWTARAATDGDPSRPCGGPVTYGPPGPAGPTVGEDGAGDLHRTTVAGEARHARARPSGVGRGPRAPRRQLVRRDRLEFWLGGVAGSVVGGQQSSSSAADGRRHDRCARSEAVTDIGRRGATPIRRAR